jgi:hypothetical protein
VAKVTITTSVKVGNRQLPVKKVPNLAPILAQKHRGAPEVMRSTVEATAIQLKVLAEETRELIIDRLFAAKPQEPAKARVRRPKRVRPTMATAPRGPFKKHRALTQKWIERKAEDSLDGRKLLATGDYVRGIEVKKGAQAAAGVYYYVRPADRKHAPSGIPLSRLARVHEFGSRKHKIPPRKHWAPAIRDVKNTLVGHVKNIRAAALRTLLRSIR